jgi:hypothetical protein
MSTHAALLPRGVPSPAQQKVDLLFAPEQRRQQRAALAISG